MQVELKIDSACVEPKVIIATASVTEEVGRVFAVTDKGEYVLRLRLYEAEGRLDSRRFVRISNSEIINLKKVSCFDLSFTGTICVKLSNHTMSYVSRRYVSKIKKMLGI